MLLRDYQQEAKAAIAAEWARGAKAAELVLPTGGGKTVIFSSILGDEPGPSVAIAHRREILGQMSLALARCGVRHAILGPPKAARQFSAQHYAELGRSWVDPRALCTVASVDSISARFDQLKTWGASVRLWVQDECHHLLESNKWGKAVGLFPNARGLGVTATPMRSDGKSLAAGQGGVFDAMVLGPTMRELINREFLTDYRIFAPPSDFTGEGLAVTSSGDFSPSQLAQAAKASHIVGDVVAHYLKLARGLRGVTFVSDVETAHQVAEAYRTAGVPAMALSAKSKDDERAQGVERLKRGELLQLVNVDLFGEGFDLPAIEVVSFARPTASYGLYAQQFGRALRPSPGKTYGMIIDHAHNVARHGLPDRPIEWSLEQPRMPKPDPKEAPVRMCLGCLQIWQGWGKTCPHCGFAPPPVERSAPEQVEGDLFELSPETLAKLRGEVETVDAPAHIVADRMRRAGASDIAVAGYSARHRERQEAQAKLRDAMAAWGDAQELSDREKQIKFFKQFGIDVLSAQALGRREAEELRGRLQP